MWKVSVHPRAVKIVSSIVSFGQLNKTWHLNKVIIIIIIINIITINDRKPISLKKKEKQIIDCETRLIAA